MGDRPGAVGVRPALPKGLRRSTAEDDIATLVYHR